MKKHRQVKTTNRKNNCKLLTNPPAKAMRNRHNSQSCVDSTKKNPEIYLKPQIKNNRSKNEKIYKLLGQNYEVKKYVYSTVLTDDFTGAYWPVLFGGTHYASKRNGPKTIAPEKGVDKNRS